MQCEVKFSLNNNWTRWQFLAALFFGLNATGIASIIPVLSTADSGVGSFRQAILTANANPGMDTIVFQIVGSPPFTITPASALPAITDPVVIDATTQPGFISKPVVELSGTLTSGSTIGLRFVTGASTLRGMAINRFPVQAIELDSASNNIQGTFIGTDVTGSMAKTNGSDGILVKSVGNLIGGTNAGEGNVISGNSVGIYILSVGGNVVQGNLIGVSASGTASLSNLNNGIIIFGGGGNIIGGGTPEARNIISANAASGVYLNGPGATGNVIAGNRIGTDFSGSNTLGNVAGDGITLNGADGNMISNNLISGNGLAGVSLVGSGAKGNIIVGNFIGTDQSGKTSLGNHLAGVSISGGGGNLIGGTNSTAGNVISGNVLDGITLTGGTGTNLIQGNLIGLSAAGTSALQNGQNGISISTSSSNIIGGIVTGARNVISGNAVNGISILQLGDGNNLVQGNYIGTDIAGTKAVANTQTGVRIQGRFNTIGGAITGAGNLISGNGQQGIWLIGTGGNVSGNIIQGNIIGLNAAGSGGLANGNAGIGISGASANQVGGTAAGARNVISANNDAGIFLVAAGATGNAIQGNFIGTDPSGAVARGNLFEGIYMELAATNQIGGSSAGAGNLISGNHTRGIWLTNASGNVFQGNFIGTKADGTNALGNTFHNLELEANANNNIIGGAAAGAGNRIGFAQSIYAGVRVRDGSVNNLISGNAIFSNGALGIDLGVVGANSIYACESGMAGNAANAGQNFPVITNVISSQAGTVVRGYMPGAAGKTYALQFFASPAGDATGYGEGQVFLGSTTMTLGSTCSSNFAAYFATAVPSQWAVSATATGPTNNTSEFSAFVKAADVPTIQIGRSGPTQYSWTNVHGGASFYTTYSNILIIYTNLGGPMSVQKTFSLLPPINWTPLASPAVQSNGNYYITSPVDGTNVFYRLTAP